MTIRITQHLALLVAAALLAACAGRGANVVTAAPATLAPALAADPAWPISVADFRTTSGEIYLGNVDARIDELRRVVAERDMAVHRTALAGSLYHRYRVVGRLDDAEEALTLLDAAVTSEPNVAEHRQLRAVVLSAFHRFDDALADLDAAGNAGAKAESLRTTRREIQLALGDYAALKDDFAHASELTPDFNELAHRADLRFLQGDLTGATFHYRAAQSQYGDVNPVPLAWLHLQMGTALLRSGDVAGAKRFFAAGHERLPQYYLTTEHLAECETLLGNYDAARALYAQVIAQTGNPEFVAALSGLERAAGNAALADRLAAQAEAGYVDLLRRNPSAYAQHAAEFFIEIGKPEKAYALAEQNVALRQDVSSWILLAQSAAAVGKSARSCEARAHALDTGLRPPELSELDALAANCP